MPRLPGPDRTPDLRRAAERCTADPGRGCSGTGRPARSGRPGSPDPGNPGPGTGHPGSSGPGNHQPGSAGSRSVPDLPG